ncbi:DUF2975 domain-containing protein [Streptomyces spirodelae]|uniref:DUF2975 domain-containing protein n=1 Tax=Streptomyces spirodelae TaxID=2812904 RepID=A0ABS3WQA5_9ACTN|nr:DUF2975 domain-containing protein [Streptomyces spirodelae]MBO8185299.1 DUF2975 domain-containing protein [Streptomyces spirodelae]
MTHLLARSLRAALVVAFALTLGVQLMMLFIANTQPVQGDIAVSRDGTAVTNDSFVDEVIQDRGGEVALCAIPALILLQAVMVCIWRLTTLAQNGKAFTPASLPYLTTTIRALAGMTLLLAILAVRLSSDHTLPLGFTLYPYGAVLASATGALVMLLLRALLDQAINRDDEATRMRSELDQVI